MTGNSPDEWLPATERDGYYEKCEAGWLVEGRSLVDGAATWWAGETKEPR